MDNNQNEEFIDVTPDVQQPISNEVQQSVNIQSNKSKLPIIIGAIIAVLVITLGVCGFLYFTNTPKILLSKNLTKLYNNLVESSSKNKSLNNILNSNSVSVNGNAVINFKDSTQSIGNIDNLKINYEYIEDKENKKGYVNFLTTLGNENIINIESLMKDNKIYYTIKDIMDKYYYSDYDFVSVIEASDDTEEIEYIYNIFKNSVINNISKSNLKESKTTTSINDKDVKAKKITLEINKNFFNKVIKEFVNDVKNDKKAINILSESFKLEENEINEVLESISTSFDESIEVETIYYNMYVKGLNTVVKDEITVGDYSFEYSNYENIVEFSVLSNNIKVANIKINEKTKKISGSLMLMLMIDGTYSDDKIDLSIKSVDNSSEIKLNIENNEKEITKDKEYQCNSDIDIIVFSNSQEVYNISLDSQMNVKNDVEVKNIDVSNSKSSLEMTEEEQNEIGEKFLNIPIIKSFIESNMNNNYDYSNEYDYNYNDDDSF